MYQLSKTAKKYIAKTAAAVSVGLATTYVHAVSQFPTTLAAEYETDLSLTVEDYKLWIIGIMFIIGIAFFAVNMTMRALGKVGGR